MKKDVSSISSGKPKNPPFFKNFHQNYVKFFH